MVGVSFSERAEKSTPLFVFAVYGPKLYFNQGSLTNRYQSERRRKHGQRVKFKHPGLIKGGVPITFVRTLNSPKHSIMHQVTASFKVKFKFG
jgi:hypothetical protein